MTTLISQTPELLLHSTVHSLPSQFTIASHFNSCKAVACYELSSVPQTTSEGIFIDSSYFRVKFLGLLLALSALGWIGNRF